MVALTSFISTKPGGKYNPHAAQNEPQERSNLSALSVGSQGGAGVNRMCRDCRIVQEANAWSNVQDMLTWTR